ncbi:carbohydrate ABC transporter permease [Cohnella thailandensis]|uniref:carbohydrate ABC transporter permease n=1 Tax=Cohnella thailandensis TaxID=557557 RepID=UPI001C8808D3|nr:carbohydrate ABC transporter permease [Cohnella thailandensis]MBP1975724.1 putative aldouronate transport system permease protein [Cohnella thailandensis]
MYGLLSLFALATLLPFIYIVLVSFTSPSEYARTPILLFPREWSTASYDYIFRSGSFMRSMGVSGFLAIVGTACSLLVTSTLAYGLSRSRLKGRRVILGGILFTMLFNPGMIPAYMIVKEYGLMNSIWSLILPSLSSAFYVLLMKGFFQEIPAELEESAKMDGSSDIGVFFRIIVPVSIPAIAAFGLFYGVGFWNTFFAGVMYITDDAKRPLQVVLQMMLLNASTGVGSGAAAQALSVEQRLPPETLKMAAVIVSSLPIIAVYPFLQRYFVSGMMLGSVKG